MRLLRPLLTTVLVATISMFASGCLGSKHAWHAQTVSGAEARVSRQELYRRTDRLFVRVTYTKMWTETVTIDRDAMTLQLATGRVLGRSAGMTSTHATYTLLANGARSIFVDFRDDDLEYERNALGS